MATDKVKRALIWLRTAFRITDKTTLPGEILGEIRPTVDTFGWDRLNPQSSGPGEGPQSESVLGPLANALVSMSVVPEGTMRYVISASMSTNDPGLVAMMRFEILSDGISMGVQEPFFINGNGFNVRIGLNRHLLMEPGDVFRMVSEPAPGGAFRNTVRMRFVDIDFGEYIAPIN